MTDSYASILAFATQQLVHLDNAQLEAEILVANGLNVDRGQLRAFRERSVSATESTRLREWVARRAKGEPLAHITGKQAFWDFQLKVTPDTLIPRADTEILVETVLQHVLNNAPKILDLGTGSGCIAIALKRELPNATVVAVDASSHALMIARDNAKALNVDIECVNSDWFSRLNAQQYDCIVANPPYIAIDDPDIADDVSAYEPEHALFSEADGLADINEIVAEAPNYLRAGGLLFIEHGYRQGAEVRALFRQFKFSEVHTVKDLNQHERVSFGRFLGA